MTATIRASIARCEWAPGVDSSGGGGWLVLAWRADDADAFADALAAVKSIPFRQRRYVPAWRAWKIRPQALTRLASQWAALRDELARLGVASGGYDDEYTYTPPPRAYLPGDAAAAFRLACLTSDAPLELIAAARKVYALRLHPDRPGGDLARAQQMNAALDLCEAFARQRSRAA